MKIKNFLHQGRILLYDRQTTKDRRRENVEQLVCHLGTHADSPSYECSEESQTLRRVVLSEKPNLHVNFNKEVEF